MYLLKFFLFPINYPDLLELLVKTWYLQGFEQIHVCFFFHLSPAAHCLHCYWNATFSAVSFWQLKTDNWSVMNSRVPKQWKRLCQTCAKTVRGADLGDESRVRQVHLRCDPLIQIIAQLLFQTHGLSKTTLHLFLHWLWSLVAVAVES